MSLGRKFKGINVLEKCYKNTLMTCGYITTNDGINFSNLYEFFKNISHYKNIHKKPMEFREAIDERINVINKDFIKMDRPDYEKRYYQYYEIYNIKDACFNYLKTLNWIFEYYNNNNHKNFNWHYKYKATPLVQDLLLHWSNNFNFESSVPYSIKEQLFYILPSNSLEKTMDEYELGIFNKFKNTQMFSYYFPSTITLNIYGVSLIWQAEIIINEMNYNLYKMLF
jgi:5'-3' exonuclease